MHVFPNLVTFIVCGIDTYQAFILVCVLCDFQLHMSCVVLSIMCYCCKHGIQAEEQLLDRDRELADLHQKVRQYESGQYGLSEAVAEIKQKKVEIAQRDE